MVITVLLLGLLLLVLVSTATLTNIETSIGFNSRRQSQAQQNALFALNRALGELQRHAGPDARITARADITSATVANPYWTGVWNPDGSLRTWLVSGNEEKVPTDLDFIRASLAVTSPEKLVGANSVSDLLQHVSAPLQVLTSDNVAGLAGTQTIGHYAWWVGDEGVKASVALPDRLSEVNYGPYAVSQNRSRLRQQVPLTHESFRATGASGAPLFGFDPAVNTTAMRNVVARPQIAFLAPASGNSVRTAITDRFHDWTSVSYGVLASTLPDADPNRGLKRDLSINPGLLGPEFIKWQNYGAYMAEPLTPAINPPVPNITSEDDVRRRYSMVVPSAAGSPGALTHRVAPILSEFIICFGVRKEPGIIKIGVRVYLALWNPYTSGLVPKTPLRVEISGLPNISVDAGGLPVVIPLQDDSFTLPVLSSPFRLALPFTGSSADEVTWLPGRVYSWRTRPRVDPPFDLEFNYPYDFAMPSEWTFGTGYNPLGASRLRVVGPPTTIQVKVFTNDNVLIGDYTGPTMSEGATWSCTPGIGASWDFGFGFRLNQPATRGGTLSPNQWLTTTNADPRDPNVDSKLLIAHAPLPAAGLLPPVYNENPPSTFRTNWDDNGVPGFILNHRTTGIPDKSFDSDTPVFELPRLPILSLGVLQHMQIANRRPFSIGNSWGAGFTIPGVVGGGSIGSWFDRFFFSGVPPEIGGWGPNIAAGQAFPFFHLRTFDPARNLTLATFRATGETDSRHLLMAGAFNVNSTSVDAWAAVLKSLRPMAPDVWSVGNLDPSTGTVTSSVGVDTPIRDLTQGPANPPGDTAAKAFAFFRFSHSAQETFQTTGPASGIDRSRFRQGFRGGSEGTGGTAGRNLTSVQIDTLAANIVANIRAKVGASGPIRSMESFVGKALPTATPTQSLIEEAISAAGINAGLPDFCSQTLTQADILTAIGPMLQCRSDTFTIRAYGETENPVTHLVEGRAWCEATVQRIPTPVAALDDIVQPPGAFGRRFQIVAFRWLSPSDI